MGKISSKSCRKYRRNGYILFIALVISISAFLAVYAANGEWWQIEPANNSKTVEYATLLFSMVAAAFAIVSFGKELDEGNKTSNAQFLIDLRNMFATPERMKIHRIIQKENNEEEIKKYTPQNDDQDGREEQLDDYLGLFEFCKILIDKGSLSEEDFLTFYRYRLHNILVSDALLNKFKEEQSDWGKFFDLIYSIKGELEISIEKVKIEKYENEKIKNAKIARAEKINDRIFEISDLRPILDKPYWSRFVSKS
jgi:hypothetical protein